MSDFQEPTDTAPKLHLEAIGRARSTVARHVLEHYPPEQRVQALYELLQELGLLPAQQPDWMMARSGPSNGWNDGGMNEPSRRAAGGQYR